MQFQLARYKMLTSLAREAAGPGAELGLDQGARHLLAAWWKTQSTLKTVEKLRQCQVFNWNTTPRALTAVCRCAGEMAGVCGARDWRYTSTLLVNTNPNGGLHGHLGTGYYGIRCKPKSYSI